MPIVTAPRTDMDNQQGYTCEILRWAKIETPKSSTDRARAICLTHWTNEHQPAKTEYATYLVIENPGGDLITIHGYYTQDKAAAIKDFNVRVKQETR